MNDGINHKHDMIFVLDCLLCLSVFFVLYLANGDRKSVVICACTAIMCFGFVWGIDLNDVLCYMKNNTKIVLLGTMIFSVSLVANPLILFMNKWYITLIVFFILYGILMIPIASLLFKLDNGVSKTRCNQIVKSRWKYFGVLLIGFFIIEAFYFLAFYPALISYDDYIVIAEAKGLRPLREYEGLYYIFTRRLLLKLFGSVTFISIAQVLYAGFVFCIIGSWIISITDKKVYYGISIAVFFIIIALPNNSLMIVTQTKDTFWAISFVWLVYSLMRILCEKGDSFLFLAQFSLAVINVWLVRQNGWVVVPVTLFFLMIYAIKNGKNKLIFASLCIVLMIVLLENLFRNTEYEPTKPGMKYIAGFQDILGVYYSDRGVIDENTQIMISNVVDDSFDDIYNPYWAEYETWIEPLGKIKVSDFIVNYVRTYVKNPILMTRALLLRLDMLWDIQCGINGSETWQWQTEFQSFGDRLFPGMVPERRITLITKIIDKIGKFSLANGLKEILWRCGLSLQVSILCVFMSIKKGEKMLKYVPFFALLGFYILGLGWSHYRYYWGVWLVSLLYLFSLGYGKKDLIGD